MRIDEAAFHTLLDTVSDGVRVVDRQRRIVHWNRSAEQITGFTAHEVIGSTCGERVLSHLNEDGRALCNEACPLEATLEEGRALSGHFYLRHKDGHRVPIDAISSPLRDSAGTITGAVEVFHEETTQTAAIERIRRLRQVALLDPLTHLGNRRYTRMMVGDRLDELRRYGWPLGLVFIDLDHLKQINDRYGHETGDRALTVVATTLLKSLRPFDFLGRWGGDEFLALIVNVEPDELRSVAERACRLVEQSLVKAEAGPFAVTVSMGAATARIEDDTDALVARADRLMYQSKLAGRNRVQTEPIGRPTQAEPPD